MSQQDSKIRVVSVDTPVGKRELTFVQESRRKNGSCCGFCPYSEVCEQLPDPTAERINDPLYSFADFCRTAGSPQEGQASSVDYVPKLGTLEQNLSGVFDVFNTLTERNRYFPLSTFIDRICSGTCIDYTEDHSGCNCNNKFCILRDLFDVKDRDHVVPDPDPNAELNNQNNEVEV